MPSDTRPRLYEGFFLFDPSAISANLRTAVDQLREVLSRADAEAAAIYKWDDRKLAYPIGGQKRGLYLLTHFYARGTQIPNIERDVNLSESMLRCLILRADHIGEAELDQARQQQRETLAAVGLEGPPAGSSTEPEGEPPASTTEETAPTEATASSDQPSA